MSVQQSGCCEVRYEVLVKHKKNLYSRYFGTVLHATRLKKQHSISAKLKLLINNENLNSVLNIPCTYNF
jgi:hypothetical protein